MTRSGTSGGNLLVSAGGGTETINVLERHFDVADGVSTPDMVADVCKAVEIVEQ